MNGDQESNLLWRILLCQQKRIHIERCRALALWVPNRLRQASFGVNVLFLVIDVYDELSHKLQVKRNREEH